MPEEKEEEEDEEEENASFIDVATLELKSVWTVNGDFESDVMCDTWHVDGLQKNLRPNQRRALMSRTHHLLLRLCGATDLATYSVRALVKCLKCEYLDQCWWLEM